MQPMFLVPLSTIGPGQSVAGASDTKSGYEYMPALKDKDYGKVRAPKNRLTLRQEDVQLYVACDASVACAWPLRLPCAHALVRSRERSIRTMS